VISITTALGFLESADGQHEIRALLAEPCVGAGWGWPPSEVHLRRCARQQSLLPPRAPRSSSWCSERRGRQGADQLDQPG